VLKRVGQVASLVRLLLLAKALVKLYRHVYAYGIIGTALQIHRAIKNVSEAPMHSTLERKRL